VLSYNNLATELQVVPANSLPVFCVRVLDAAESTYDRSVEVGLVDVVVTNKHIPSLPPAQFHDLAFAHPSAAEIMGSGAPKVVHKTPLKPCARQAAPRPS
jgi:hypothetical protein